MPLHAPHPPPSAHSAPLAQVGEDLQAFSDFLFFVLSGSNALLSELAIAVFDSTTGGVEVYRGVHYPDPAATTATAATPPSAGGRGKAPTSTSDAQLRANLLCLKYLPGHYQALVVDAPAAGWPRQQHHQHQRHGPTLGELLSCLDLYAVRYVVTDG